MRFLVAVIIFFCLFAFKLFSVDALLEDGSTLSGYVYDAESQETVVGATIYLKGTKLGAFSNKSGYFVINNIPSGKFEVQITAVGYEKYVEVISFEKKQSIRKNFKLKPSAVQTGEVSVEAEREVERREITVSKVNIPMQQISRIRVGGETDVFRSLQYLPGILTSSQISSSLFVRGGSPDQNLVLLDGSAVYNPSHIFGFISTFNTDAIKDVELIKGGFPAEYGGRLSAVLNLTQKDGNKNQFKGGAAIGALSSRLNLEGPLLNGSWFIGARRTYLEVIKLFIPEDPEAPLPDFNFYDINAKVAQDFGDNDKFFVSGFMSADKFGIGTYGVNMDLSIANKLISGRWTHIFGDNLFAVLNVSASNYVNKFKGDQSGYKFLVENSITDYTFKGGCEWFATENLTAKFGFETVNYHFSYLQNFTGDVDSTAIGSSGGTINLKVKDWNHSVFGQINYAFTDLISLQAGLRVNYWELSNILSWDPRVAVRYQLTDNIALKSAFGIFHQSLRLATQPDFTFFDTWLPTDRTVPASKAYHYIFSVETFPMEDVIFNFDIYYKDLKNVNEININTLQASKVSDVFFIGNAHSYGLELFLQRKVGKFTGWIGYALGYIFAKFDDINEGREFRPKYDRRHDLKIVAQYQINENWDVGGSFTFQSGQSYTGATSRFQSRLYGENYGRGKVVPSERYGLRLPPSHQLNLNASYAFRMFGLKSRVIFDIYNVYNRRDIWFRYYDSRDEVTIVEDVKLLPIIPTITFEVNF